MLNLNLVKVNIFFKQQKSVAVDVSSFLLNNFAIVHVLIFKLRVYLLKVVQARLNTERRKFKCIAQQRQRWKTNLEEPKQNNHWILKARILKKGKWRLFVRLTRRYCGIHLQHNTVR